MDNDRYIFSFSTYTCRQRASKTDWHELRRATGCPAKGSLWVSRGRPAASQACQTRNAAIARPMSWKVTDDM
jgi:hypothetical protein